MQTCGFGESLWHIANNNKRVKLIIVTWGDCIFTGHSSNIHNTYQHIAICRGFLHNRQKVSYIKNSYSKKFKVNSSIIPSFSNRGIFRVGGTHLVLHPATLGHCMLFSHFSTSKYIIVNKQWKSAHSNLKNNQMSGWNKMSMTEPWMPMNKVFNSYFHKWCPFFCKILTTEWIKRVTIVTNRPTCARLQHL